MTTAFFHNPRKDLSILGASLIAIAVAWFGIPAGMSAVKHYQWYRSHSVVLVTLSEADRKTLHDRIRKTRNDIRANVASDKLSRARAYELLARDYRELGLLGKSVHAYASADAINSQDADLILDFAEVTQLMTDYPRSEVLYRRAIDREPARIESYQKLADMYFYDSKIQKPRAVFMWRA